MKTTTLYIIIVLIFGIVLSCKNEKPANNKHCYSFNHIKPTIQICDNLNEHPQSGKTIYTLGPNMLNWTLRIIEDDSVLIQTASLDSKDSALLELFLKTEKDLSFPSFKSLDINQVIVIKNGKIDSSNSSCISTVISEKKDSIVFDFYSINNRKANYLMQSWVFSDIDKTNYQYTNWTSKGWNRMKIEKESNLDTLKGLLFINGFTEIYNDSVLMTLERQTIKINLPLKYAR